MTKHIAHITIQAQTPLKVGSNSSDFLQDSPIQKDWNNLPMILGTSIAGVLRKDFDNTKVQNIFGDDNNSSKKDKDKCGSKVIISNALLVDEKNLVHENLLLEKSKFLKLFDILPIREHTAITNKGVAKDTSKFDEEVVYSGTRFKFTIELIEDNEEIFNNILNLLASTSFRLGGGSTKGFGKFSITEIQTQKFDKNSYQNYTNSLNHKLETTKDIKTIDSNDYDRYILKIKPDDFFMFGSGFGDDDADMTPVYEKTIDYENGGLSDNKILIPASSIKGVISHRTVYHYNKQNSLFVGNIEAKEKIIEIFGQEKNSKENIDDSKGKVIFSDAFYSKADTKVFDHVSIDRFTGGAIDGALFQEKTISDDKTYEIEVLLQKNIENEFIKAFESSLKDITTGMLSLGGATTKGHGVFSGVVEKNGEKI
jgi:CRISPR/Cas system CMR subunit Cmr4 (Cas7 group RAMP superfamily)